MKPKKSPNRDPQASLFQVELAKLVDLRHPLVQLAEKIDWERFEAELECHFCATDGAPAKPTRLMVGLHYLKRAYNLSDEQTVKRWVENPYWQHFCGRKHFEHSFPIHSSLMTRRRWRKRSSAIEPVIGHMKNDGRLGRNYLLGKDGDRVNVVLSAAGHNLRLILARLAEISRGTLFLFACLAAFFRRIASAVTIQPRLAGRDRATRGFSRPTTIRSGYSTIASPPVRAQ